MLEPVFGVFTATKKEARPGETKPVRVGWMLKHRDAIRYGPYKSHDAALKNAKRYAPRIEAEELSDRNYHRSLPHILAMLRNRTITQIIFGRFNITVVLKNSIQITFRGGRPIEWGVPREALVYESSGLRVTDTTATSIILEGEREIQFSKERGEIHYSEIHCTV